MPVTPKTVPTLNKSAIDVDVAKHEVHVAEQAVARLELVVAGSPKATPEVQAQVDATAANLVGKIKNLGETAGALKAAATRRWLRKPAVELDTKIGPVDESKMDFDVVPYDGPDMYALDGHYRLRGTIEVIAVLRDVQWRKVTADQLVIIEIDGVRSVVPVDTLDKTLTQIDDENEYNCRVEYRLKTTGVLVHESAHVFKKLPPAAAGSGVGNLGGGPRKIVEIPEHLKE